MVGFKIQTTTACDLCRVGFTCIPCKPQSCIPVPNEIRKSNETKMHKPVTSSFSNENRLDVKGDEDCARRER